MYKDTAELTDKEHAAAGDPYRGVHWTLGGSACCPGWRRDGLELRSTATIVWTGAAADSLDSLRAVCGIGLRGVDLHSLFKLFSGGHM